jgi:phage shock protein PspC (stress-responsive transcriptional regulator)
MTQQPYDASSAGPTGATGSAGPTGPRSNPRQDLRFLRRSSDDRMIAGVCGGLGHYTNVDPVVFRVSFAVLGVFGGVGLLLYALAWLLVPAEQSGESAAQQLLNGRWSGVAAVGVAVAASVVALGVLADHGWPGPVSTVLLVLALVAVVVYRRGWVSTTNAARPVGGDAATAAQPAATAAEPAATAAQPTATAAQSAARDASASTADDPPPWVYAEPVPPPAAREVTRRERSLLTPAALSLAVAVVGVLLALDIAGAIAVTPAVVLAAGLLTIGAALVAGAWLGRGRGLIAVGALLTVGLMAASLVDVPLRGGIGARDVAPASLAELQPAYHIGIGREKIDLTALSLDGATRHVAATVGIGQLRVVVPPTATVRVHASTSAGSVDIDGAEENGRTVNRTITLPALTTPADGALELDLHAGVGQVEVDRAGSKFGALEGMSR